jgi:hypothetical protein
MTWAFIHSMEAGFVLQSTDGIGSCLNILHGHPESLVKLSRCHA